MLQYIVQFHPTRYTGTINYSFGFRAESHEGHFITGRIEKYKTFEPVENYIKNKIPMTGNIRVYYDNN